MDVDIKVRIDLSFSEELEYSVVFLSGAQCFLMPTSLCLSERVVERFCKISQAMWAKRFISTNY